jgi:hypothetical protein
MPQPIISRQATSAQQNTPRQIATDLSRGVGFSETPRMTEGIDPGLATAQSWAALGSGSGRKKQQRLPSR